MKLSIIKNFINTADEISESSFIDIEKNLESYKFKWSIKAILSLDRRKKLLLDSILSLDDISHLYSLNILNRSFIEHSVRSFYFLINCAQTHKDDKAKLYWNEFLMYETSNWMSKTKENEKDLPSTTIRLRKAKEIKSTSNLFGFNLLANEIRKYLKSKSDSETAISNFQAHFSTYSDLSSFTHGGPNSWEYMTEKESIINHQAYYDNILKLTSIMYVNDKDHPLMLVRKFTHVQDKLKELRHEFFRLLKSE
jgi:hypothetical protein